MTNEQALSIVEKIIELQDAGAEKSILANAVTCAFDLLPTAVQEPGRQYIVLTCRFEADDYDAMGMLGEVISKLAEGGILPKLNAEEKKRTKTEQASAIAEKILACGNAPTLQDIVGVLLNEEESA